MKNRFIPALAVLILLFSCSDWVDSKSKDYLPQIKQNDPAYLASLREFKANASGHKIVILTIQGTSAAPTRQSQHPTAMPDSVDYLLMTNVDDLHPTVVDEIAAVRSTKGTRSLNVVDYAAILNTWNALKEVAADTEHEGDYTPDKYPDYCKAQTELRLANCTKYGFDGIVVSYTTSPQNEIAGGQAAFMASVKTWRANNSDRLLFMRVAYMPNLLAPELLLDSKYIIFVATASQKTGSDLTLWARNHIRDTKDKIANLPTDRFVMETAIPSLETDEQIGPSARITAQWVVDPTKDPKVDYDKVGLCILDAVNDYFNNLTNYKNVREAIGILNPEKENDNENDHEE